VEFSHGGELPMLVIGLVAILYYFGRELPMRPLLGGLISLAGFALLMAGRTDTPALILALILGAGGILLAWGRWE
jgi:hypothetical protein